MAKQWTREDAREWLWRRLFDKYGLNSNWQIKCVTIGKRKNQSFVAVIKGRNGLRPLQRAVLDVFLDSKAHILRKWETKTKLVYVEFVLPRQKRKWLKDNGDNEK